MKHLKPRRSWGRVQKSMIVQDALYHCIYKSQMTLKDYCNNHIRENRLFPVSTTIGEWLKDLHGVQWIGVLRGEEDLSVLPPPMCNCAAIFSDDLEPELQQPEPEPPRAKPAPVGNRYHELIESLERLGKYEEFFATMFELAQEMGLVERRQE